MDDGNRRALIADALEALEVRRLVLAIHDPSFPSDPDEETGRGSPYTEGGRRFLRYAAALGFNGVQFGPQGELSSDNPSPYDGTIFARSTLSIALAPLTRDERWGRLLPPEAVTEIVTARPRDRAGRANHRHAHAAQEDALREAYATFRRSREEAGQGSAAADLAARLEVFRRKSGGWLSRDALYEPLCRLHGGGHFRHWGSSDLPDLDARLFAPDRGEAFACAARVRELSAEHAAWLEEHALRQLIAHEQHAELRELTRSVGLTLYGDLQVGMPPRDLWAYRALFLRDYCMGAPPSRTNPEGQAWGYPVLDPEQYQGAAGGLMRARIEKMLDEYDGIRVDHPHGLVSPWVYRNDIEDSESALEAVRAGARLFCSPNLADHPALARYAIAHPMQLDLRLPRYDDRWVTSLMPAQVDRYAAIFELIVGAVRARGLEVGDLVCEVLSTMPFPLRAVLERYGLGRFRVTQKANMKEPGDVYRSENAAPADWIMVGNHDTPPLWALIDRWKKEGQTGERAAYLAGRLAPRDDQAEPLARAFARDPALLARACFADLFASRARHVSIFFSDLFGLKDTYNRPGTVSDDNWSLRVPSNYQRLYPMQAARGMALDLPRVLAMALRARGGAETGDRAALADALMSLPAAPVAVA